MHGHWFRGITPPSDVTCESKVNANAGTAEVSGVVPGAWFIQPGVSNALVGECGLSRSRRFSSVQAARQSHGRWCVYGWCRDTYATTKGPTGFTHLDLAGRRLSKCSTAALYPWQGHDRRCVVHREMNRAPQVHWRFAAMRERRFETRGFHSATGMDWARGTYGSKCPAPSERPTWASNVAGTFSDGDGMTHAFGRALPFTADGGKESGEALVFPYFDCIVAIRCRNGKASASAS